MPGLLQSGFAAAALLLAGSGTAWAMTGVQRVERPGRCDPAPPLEGMLRRNDGVQQIVNVPCDRISFEIPPEATGGAGETREVAFLRGSGTELRFAGRWAENGDFNVDSVRVGEQAAVPVTGPGRCRFYADDTSLRMVMCFAVFDREGGKQAAVVGFTAG